MEQQETTELPDNRAVPLAAVGVLDPRTMKRLRREQVKGVADRVAVAAFNASL